MNKKIFTLFILLLLLPVTALAAGEDKPGTLWVGQTQITADGYWKTNPDGTLTTEGANKDNYNVYYDGNGTLTLNNATIQGRGYSGNPQPEDYGIYAAPTGNQSVSLTINLMGSNTVSGYCGICVETTTADNASLVIQPAENDPQGSLEAIGNKYNGITISSGSGNASLTINNAPVVAISKSPAPNSYHGVCIKTGIATAPALSLLVNGGSLTAQGESGYGIYFYMRDSTTDPSTSLTVQNNALVKATPSIVTSNNLSKPDTTAGSESGGIVFDGKNGTVYGDVTLQENLEIGKDETLTIPEDASLNANGKLTNDGTIIVKGELTGDVEGNGSIPITNITLDKTVLSLDVDKTATLRAMITPEQATEKAVTWISNNTNIATVDENGTVTAVSVGTVIITVTTADDSKTATCEVTVAHSDLKHFDRKEATCTEPGNIEYWHCEGCGKYFKDENATEKITFDETIIKAAGHNEELVGAKEATCTEEGYTGDKICTVCKAVLKKGTVIPAIGHKLTKTEAKSPTCTEPGNIEYWHCEGCGKYFKDENATEKITFDETIIKAAGHNEELVGAKEATCTEEGYTGDKICTVCKAVLKKGTVIPAIGHKLTKTEAKSPTCTEDGNIEYWTCSVCNAHFSDEAGTTEISLDETVIPATGHHYVNGYCTECGQRDPDYRPDPISYYNIYVEDVCDGVEISTSKQVVREGGSITVYVEKDTANYTFDNFKVYYKRSYYGGWEELKEGTQPGEYPIKNIWTHIYIKAEGAEEKEDPTGIESIEGVKVYTKDGSLYVQTPQREQVIIVSMSGAVVKNEEQIGLKQYHGLQPGIYIVRVGDRAYKVRLN